MSNVVFYLTIDVPMRGHGEMMAVDGNCLAPMVGVG
jgi:hypothetical protein